MPEPFSWFMFVPEIGADHKLLTIAHTWVVTLLLLAMAWLVRGHLKRKREELTEADLIPEDRLTLRNLFEIYVEGIHGMMHGLLKEKTPQYFWLIGTLFIYIMFSNMAGLVPGLLPPTENINTNAAMAIIVFLVYNYVGIKTQGVGPYFKHMLGPIIWIAPLMFVVETISHFVRPASLSIRLFGNINGDHYVLAIFSQVIPSIVSPILGVGVPVIFLGLGLFVSFVQAFVFALLSVVYIALAVTEEEHH